jgi:Holliday junction resolvase
MRTPSEKSIRDAIVRYLRRVGAWHVVTTGVGRSGVPDLLVCYRGYFVALEVKKPVGGKVSKLQAIEIKRIDKAGGEAQVVTSLEDVEAIIAKIDAWEKTR